MSSSIRRSYTGVTIGALLSILLAAALTTQTQGQFFGLIPDELLDLIPEECEQESNDAIGCIIGTFCFSILDVLNVTSIPDPSTLVECEDIAAPLCPIINTCTGCEQAAEELFLCIVQFSDGIDPNITDLVEDCRPLSC